MKTLPPLRFAVLVLSAVGLAGIASAQNIRLTNDTGGGYVSTYTLATGTPYTDAVLTECSIARGRQNEPAVAVDPRNTNVLIGSSNDYCGVYAFTPPPQIPSATGPIWLGYYRSENGGASFRSSLVPGYPSDTSPYAALAKIRTASSGDPVIAWDGHGRVFLGSESSEDPAGTKKTFGDEWVAVFDNPGGEGGATVNDGKRFRGSQIVAKGASAVAYVKSANCGATFSNPAIVATFVPSSAVDVGAPEPVPSGPKEEGDFESGQSAAGSLARDCGDFDLHCQSGYTFFRRDNTPRSTADQYDTAREWVYIVYETGKPGTEVNTGTTYGSITPGRASQSGAYFVRLNGATGVATAPALLDAQAVGHQIFPDISADGGVLHTVWWDSRLDPSYSVARPIGNDAAGGTHPSLDVWAAKSTDGGVTWTGKARQTNFTSNGNYEQFSNRGVPFAGDYLWVTSLGSFAYGAWTDWRDTVAGADPREPSSADNADVLQCRTFDTAAQAWSGDLCPRNGGLDQNIYGRVTP